MSTRQPPARPRRRSLLASALVLGASAPFASLAQTKPSAMTPNINADAKLTTLINVFSVAAEDRDRLVALLKEGTDAWISKVPGFVSSSLHVSAGTIAAFLRSDSVAKRTGLALHTRSDVRGGRPQG